MPIQYAKDDDVIYTVLTGRVTDEELLSYYQQPVFQGHQPPWHEIVDGRQVTDMAVSPVGHRRLAALAAAKEEKLRGGRVAMVASSDVTYGMFRMWEIQREDLNYEVRVFREIEKARVWVSSSPVTV